MTITFVILSITIALFVWGAVVGTAEAMASEVAGLRPRAGVAVAALAGMVVLMVTGIVSTVIAALIAAAAMVLGGCLSARESYRSVSWSSVVLIAAMIWSL